MGDSLWFEDEKEKKLSKIEIQKIPEIKLSKKSIRGRLYVTPSSLVSKSHDAKFDFSGYFLKNNRGKERGTIIHALFASIDWLKKNPEARKDEFKLIARRAATTFSEKECDECVDEFLNYLEKTEIKKILTKQI